MARPGLNLGILTSKPMLFWLHYTILHTHLVTRLHNLVQGNRVYFVYWLSHPIRIQTPWSRYVCMICSLPHSPSPIIVLSTHILNEWSGLVVGPGFWLLLVCSFPIIPLLPFAHSQTSLRLVTPTSGSLQALTSERPTFESLCHQLVSTSMWIE